MPPRGRTWLRKAKNCTGRCPADAGMKSKCLSRAGSCHGPSDGKVTGGRPHHRDAPLAGAEQRVQRGAERVAADGAEGAGVGDGLEAGRLLDRPCRLFIAVNRVPAGEEFPQPVAHGLGGGLGERSPDGAARLYGTRELPAAARRQCRGYPVIGNPSIPVLRSGWIRRG